MAGLSVLCRIVLFGQLREKGNDSRQLYSEQTILYVFRNNRAW
ncbi:hypothetical protein HMPREF1988_01687 [Porphyromonas gingivalis F0185]|nr:hypothetical protein HMPREF1988_01687 [Porphyromonas gingivalis F0185]